ncbi:site-specific integrase [bacterium]|nr:site-specific integrase [bacterium]NBW78233.1 site-specific integrase [Betaproteobacteria bacterium]NDC95686.1 site-specific integrase [bacterium]NDD85398.1 site-specific integrase [bacterium]
MSGMRATEFMLQLAKSLVDGRGVSESTASQYIQTLYSLNNKTAFNNLAWLKNTGVVGERLATFAPTTQRGYVSAIVSVLTPLKDKPTYKKVYQHYYDLMMKGSKEARENKPEGKSDKQSENWLDWSEVQKKRTELREECLKFATKKHISPAEYICLLKYVVLSLYTDIQPRRNQDYMDMYVVKKWDESCPKDRNYLDNAKNPSHFVFNKYKTAKKYGEQKVSIPNTAEAPLGDALVMYLRHHPLVNGKTKEAKFLVAHDGTPLESVNAITRILNKIFRKKIGSSMLRHIYITGKYGDMKKEMEDDAEAMGHSVKEQQSTYNVPSLN